jgi:putative membrane-bound dehydrogenase-like protein
MNISHFCSSRLWLIALTLALPAGFVLAAEPMPTVPADLQVGLFAREPQIRNPAAMAFDRRGRLFVGQGPQYRNPKPDTPPDSVVMLTDADGDGVAESAKTFATGLNSIQGLAWHGRDLWIGNSPDLTVVRDLDGDDVADEYVRVYTDLGNLEHANHGHTWGPDGKLYFSHGTSKGLTKPGRVAPLPFRQLWGVTAPAGTPDFPEPQIFKRADYRAVYQDPQDDWGREGGLLRSDDMGRSLEIVSRGMRNPWDVAFDGGFNWLATDNDQSEGDRVIMPFFNAHFGWGHSWSTNWTGRDHPPTVPVSAPVYDGSGTGLVYYDLPQLPPAYRGVWFINDYLRKTTFVYRPRWDGALLQPEGGRWQPFIVGGGSGRAVSFYGPKLRDKPESAEIGSLFKPIDIVIGPEGALYVSGWGQELDVVWKDGRQANEGRVFRVSWPGAPRLAWNHAKRAKPMIEWTIDELADDLGSFLPVWNIDAQDELVRRGPAVVARLQERLAARALTESAETWLIWTVGRIAMTDLANDNWLASVEAQRSLNTRIQAIRIAAHRRRETGRTDPLPGFVLAALKDPEARVRFAAVQSIGQARETRSVDALQEVVATETDRVTTYAAWQALRQLATPAQLGAMLSDPRANVRRAALLALAEDDRIDRAQVQQFVSDPDASLSELAANWIAKRDGNPLIDIYPKPGIFMDSVEVKLTPGIKPASLRHTTDGSEPTPRSAGGSPRRFTETTTLKVGLFVDNRQVGNTLVATYRKRESGLQLPTLGEVATPTTVPDVLPLLARADAVKGPGLFNAAGCVACHRVGDLGNAVGPDLSAIGERDDADSLIRSILMPNQIIVEGYSLLTVSTRSGGAFAGILKEETDRMLTLVQISGEPVSIDKSTIASRQSVHSSPMPAYDRVFSPTQLADLVAWLMQQRTTQGGATVMAATTGVVASPEQTAGFEWNLGKDKLTISRNGRPVGAYVFSDPVIQRPYLENFRAPSGVQVTRNNPVKPQDASDHDTMHPGIWTAFGDINGQDFWRNKATIKHVGFTRAPAVNGDVFTFATENRLLAADGSGLGRQDLEFSVRLNGEDAYLLTLDSTIRGAGVDLTFGDQEEMGLGVRVENGLTEKSGGLVTSSSGLRGAKTVWGTKAEWANYAREFEGRSRGVAIFPSASNPVPTWWHSRDYGVIVANGFGAKVLPANAGGKLKIKSGEALRLRFGVLFYDTPASRPPDFAAQNRAFQSMTR